MGNFKCRVCGKIHDYYKSMDLIEPEVITNMSDIEKEERIESFDDGEYFLVDKKYILIKCNLTISIQENDDFFHWTIWVNVTPQAFFTAVKELRNKTVAILDGKISSEIPQYENSKDIPIQLKFDISQSELPMVNKIFDTGGSLKVDFEHGITKAKLIFWMEQFYHP